MQQNTVEQYGPFPKDKDALTAWCRLLQSWYRVEVLGHECGPWRRETQPVGSSLVDGKTTGANFISEMASRPRKYLDFKPPEVAYYICAG
jgi:hypothetical protein